MSRLTGILFLLGVVLIGAAGMMAVDAYMTDARKDAVRAEINTQLDEGAARYDERRDSGCRRRCGFFGSMSSAVTSLRDGIFSSLPFDPETVMPAAPEGWTVSGYDLATMETLIGAKLKRTVLASSTNNRILGYFADSAALAKTGAVRLYRNEAEIIALAVVIDREGLRKPKAAYRMRPGTAKPTALALDGLALGLFPQVSRDSLRDTTEAVDYRHFLLDLDGQVAIHIVTRAEGPSITTFLDGFDLRPIVAGLPRVPEGYHPDNKPAEVANAAAVSN